MAELISTKKINDKAVLVALIPQGQSDEKTNEYLDELEFLAETLDIETVDVFTQRLESPDRRTFIGKGKLEEVIASVNAKDADVVIFDDDLTPSQLRNLEKELRVKIYDRSLLILDIFLKRAQTSQAKTQVELARFQYLMPRLTRMWTHLERQRGGTATRGGAGEKEIETDRRIIRDQITVLKKKLEKIEKQSATRRKSRKNIVRVALVGYTNAGKSTLMRMLSKEAVYAKDELFATVDSTVRKVVINQIPFLLSDTVGFIRKLPHDLVESFKSTLDEVKEADLLLHVIDVSNPAFEEHMEVVEQTLADINASEIETVKIYNKIDVIDTDSDDDEELSATAEEIFSGEKFNEKDLSFRMSAHSKEDVNQLRKILYEQVKSRHIKIYPHYLEPQTYDPEAVEE
ncbi:MAG: GTPase HflX [Cyclobacteriaceae bacterium]